MMFKYLSKLGGKFRKSFFFAFIGTFSLAVGVIQLVSNENTDIILKVLFGVLCVLGLLIVLVSISDCIKTIKELIDKEKVKISINDSNVDELLGEQRLLVNGPKIVVIGGGTGLSTMLRGLKNYTNNITAIVTVGDDGGGSGMLRDDLGMLPPGDIRNCILALADTEPIMEELLKYRFKEGTLKGQNFGNLFLAAMDGISDNFEDAVQKMSSVLAVTGKVLPVTLDDMKLVAELENGNRVVGESKIPKEAIEQKSRIKRLSINPKKATPLKDALDAIEEADAIVIGPGSLYTSIIPNLLVNDIVSTIENSSAIKIYISNVMTQPGESDNFTVADHIDTLIKHSSRGCIDYVIANNGEISQEIIDRYKKGGSEVVQLDKNRIKDLGIDIIEGNLAKVNKGYVKHNTEYLAELIMATVLEKKLQYDRERTIEYLYISNKIGSQY